MTRPTRSLDGTGTRFGAERMGDTYLFDVGVIALAHTDAPVRDAALEYVRDAITEAIDAVVPYPAVISAHAVLTTDDPTPTHRGCCRTF